MATDRASLSKVVSEKIRGQILAGRLKPGERLVEDRLSAELGVSRVPVREALRGLSMEGLVRLEPNRGATVTEVTPETSSGSDVTVASSTSPTQLPDRPMRSPITSPKRDTQ